MPGAIDREAELGSLIDGLPYKRPSIGRVIQFLLGGSCLLGGAAVIVLGLLDVYDQYYRHGPAIIFRSLVLPLALGVVLGMIGLAIIRAAYVHPRKSLGIYSKGWVLSSGSDEQAWRWDELASIRTAVTRRYFLGIPGSTRHVYTLVRRDGERMVLDDDLKNVERLAEKIRDQAIPVLYSRYSHSFDQGVDLAFGPIVINRKTGFNYKNNTFAWEKIQQANVQKGMLTITVAEKRGSKRTVHVDVQDIPNLDVLLILICRMIGIEVNPDNTSAAAG